MPEALLLELEGVLIETSDARRSALARAFRDEGFAAAARSCEAHPMTQPARESALAVLSATGEPADAVAIDLVVARAEREFMRIISSGISLAPGALELVHSAVGRVRLALVTRARRSEAVTMLSLASLRDALDVVVTLDDVPDPRPSPAGHEIALARLAKRRPVNRSTVIALEDAAPGIRAATAAGVRAIGVGSESLPAHEALAAGAIAFVQSLATHSHRTLAALAAARAREERAS